MRRLELSTARFAGWLGRGCKGLPAVAATCAATLAGAAADRGPSGAIIVGDIEYSIVRPATGTVAKLNLKGPLRDLAPWPDRRSFVASDAQWDRAGGVFRARLVGNGLVLARLTKGEDYHPAVSWDARTLVYERGHELWVKNLSSAAPRLLAKAPIRASVVSEADLRDLSPPYDQAWSWSAWLPGDVGLVALYDQPPQGAKYELHYVPFKGKRFTGRLPRDPVAYCFNAAGTRLCWVDGRARAWVAKWSARQGVLGAKPLRLSRSQGVAWSPDGDYVAVLCASGDKRPIYLWSLATGKTRKIATIDDPYTGCDMVWLRG